MYKFSVADREHVSRLKHDLLVGYDPFVLPKTGENATQLVITLHPQKIDLVRFPENATIHNPDITVVLSVSYVFQDEKTSTFTLTGVLVMVR